ncbi:TPA: hypothetical protein N2D10_003202 [Clostridium botulinum]|nr:hypothetical protein [Clostridium botulinum]
MNLNESDLKELFEEYNEQVYICSKCGRIVFPTLKFNNDKISFVTNKGCIRGGVGNMILKDDICPTCMKFSNVISKIEVQLNMNELK